jgi:hypothetical protein
VDAKYGISWGDGVLLNPLGLFFFWGGGGMEDVFHSYQS